MATAEPVLPQLGARRLRRFGGTVLVAVLGALAAGCGSQAAGPSGTSAPSTSAGAGGGTTSTRPPCPNLASTSRHAAGATVVLDAAALLTATITVVPGAGGPTCTILRSGASVTLRVGQRVELVANHPPSLSGVPPAAGTGAVGVATAPGPTTTGPAGGPPTAHLTVTITARRPGTVRVRWIDCSGTAC